MNYGFVIDTGSCIGCHACSTACKSENQVPLGVNRTWVKYTETGVYPDATRHFQVTRCNHCQNPPCARACPVTAMYQRDDGIVEFDADVCIGCKACTQACPYDAIYMDPDSGTAAKCHFCAHRVDQGREPACVTVCPEHAILAGDLDDPLSEVSRALATKSATVRRPEQGTSPKVFYVEGNEVALHPSVAEQLDVSFVWADRQVDHHHSHPAPTGGGPGTGTSFKGDPIRRPQTQGAPAGGPVQIAGSQAGHMVQVAYNAQHRIQWHWPIPLYIATKGTAAGIFLLFGAGFMGAFTPSSTLFVAAGAIGVALMVITSILLLIDLDRPERFLFLFTRPQWRSWVARAAWILSGFSTLSGLWWAIETAGWLGWLPEGLVITARWALLVPVMPLAVMTGIYTAFLFAQMEGRDLWQSKGTPLLMGLQTMYLGTGAVLAFEALYSAPGGIYDVARPVFIASTVLAFFIAIFVEVGMPSAGEAAARAAKDIRSGRFKGTFWGGAILVGLVLPTLLMATGVPALAQTAAILAFFGVFAYQLAWVMAPQHIPNS